MVTTELRLQPHCGLCAPCPLPAAAGVLVCSLSVPLPARLLPPNCRPPLALLLFSGCKLVIICLLSHTGQSHTHTGPHALSTAHPVLAHTHPLPEHPDTPTERSAAPSLCLGHARAHMFPPFLSGASLYLFHSAREVLPTAPRLDRWVS